MNLLNRILQKFAPGNNAVFPAPNSAASVAYPAPGATINQHYITAAPSEQNALDIFQGEWSSKLPAPFAELQAGNVSLFADGRIEWFASAIGGFQQQRVLELGPLEGGHSYMLDRMGAQSVTAIESNTHAYLRCLIAKELLGMPSIKFLCGDFMAYLRSDDCPSFDIALASGVLYHMTDPVDMIQLLAAHCRNHLLFWTHYYDVEWAATPAAQTHLHSTQMVEHAGFRCTFHRYEYGVTLGWGGFCGGPRPYSNWMERAELLACLRHFGFSNIRIGWEQPDHPHGPAFALAASRG